ncbi:MAG: EMC3/TMCO1 family protein [Candidatus Bathyarchaeia archaeon]
MDADLLLTIPISTFFILGLSMILGLVTSTVQRKFVNLSKMREVRGKMSELRKEMFAARKKGDRKTYAKLQKRQSQMMKESSAVMGQQTKVMLITTFPFLGVFWFLASIFGQTVVAVAPFPLPYGTLASDPTLLPFWLWYFLSALTVNMPVNRIFRIYG